MKPTWPFVAALILVLVAAGSAAPESGPAMDLGMAAAAALAGTDPPGDAECDGGEDPPADCGLCHSPIALAVLPDTPPAPAPAAVPHPGGGTRLAGMTGPPDTAPPRGLRRI